MKKILALALALVMCSLCFAACSVDSSKDLENVQKKGKMVVGITEYEPMNYKDANGDWTGFDTEFAQKVGEKLGVEVEFVEIVWDKKAMELESGNIDCVWNGMTLSNEVMEAMDCSKPYVVNAQVLVMKADVVNNYEKVEDLKDLTFVAEKGSTGAQAITDAGYTATEVDTQAKALMEVKNGTADACVIDITMAKAMTGEGTDYADLSYGLAFTSEEYGIGFRKGSTLLAEVNKIMDELKADNTLKTLAEKYNLTLAE
ncbi:MAG: transporter substrate-binding domain-containing protein [Clostridia bacterium]|nr:transporter substrate-binding domain-containing protein [Clostridia bacterium]